MGLIRLLVFAAIIYFVYRLVRNAIHTPAPKNTDPIAMVKCQQCRVLFPQHDAITKNQLHFCSAEHLNQWLENNG